jgi:alkylation response protein AidB-like acyl-CoA dehydrogenase
MDLLRDEQDCKRDVRALGIHEGASERYYRDARSYQIVEGSANIQKLIIAQDALGYRKANR